MICFSYVLIKSLNLDWCYVLHGSIAKMRYDIILNAQLILACCKGTAKTAGNFLWRYAELSFERGVKEIQIRLLKEKLSTIAEELSALERNFG